MCTLRRDLKQSEPSVGPGGDQAVSSRPSDQQQRTPDGRNCCDGNVVQRVDGGWQNRAADDWQLLTLECNIRLDTADACLVIDKK